MMEKSNFMSTGNITARKDFMHTARFGNTAKGFIGLVTLMASAWTTGCGVKNLAPSSVTPVQGAAVHGSIHGGQQPVSGSTIQLYAATTSGYGAASLPLISATVTSDTSGSFSITGDYTCPSAATEVYLVAHGGNPGLSVGTNNTALTMMAALGPCGNLSTSTFISVNELTTVASVWALSRFMSSYSSLGTSPTNSVGVANAFNSVSTVVNLSTGSVPGPNLPSGATLPVAEVNTLADILSACINSTGGSAGDGTACGNLFAAATPTGGSAPTDTIGAALDIARFPTNNVAALYAVSPPAAPFQPTLPSSPTNFLIGINYASSQLNGPTKIAIDAQGSVWAANQSGNSVSQFSNTGSLLSLSPYTIAGISQPTDIAIDVSGNAWVTNKGNNSITKLTAASGVATGTNFTDSSLSLPSAIAIDASGDVWITNAGANTLTELNNTGTVLSPVGGFTGAGLSAPASIAINVH
jgi:hypothetical protein